MLTTTIRRAGPQDAWALADIGRRTFVESFGRLYPPQDLAAFLEAAHSPAALGRRLADPAQAAWIAEQDGQAVGHALAGPCDLPHADVTSTCGEVKRLYVSAQRQGEGLGERLLTQVLAWLERDGPRQVWLGVWSANHGALRFYRRFGFEMAGEYEFPVGATWDREFILRRPATGR